MSKAHWRLVAGGVHQYIVGIAVIGDVFEEKDKFVWTARVMDNCRLPYNASPAPTGKALTLDGAKRIVEVLCQETGTATWNVPSKKETQPIDRVIADALGVTEGDWRQEHRFYRTYKEDGLHTPEDWAEPLLTRGRRVRWRTSCGECGNCDATIVSGSGGGTWVVKDADTGRTGEICIERLAEVWLTIEEYDKARAAALAREQADEDFCAGQGRKRL